MKVHKILDTTIRIDWDYKQDQHFTNTYHDFCRS